jgi:excisionase family DNA binding protein
MRGLAVPVDKKKQPPPRLAVSPEEAGRVLSVSRITIWRLMQSKALPYFHISKRVRRIPMAAIEAYIQAQLELEEASA